MWRSGWGASGRRRNLDTSRPSIPWARRCPVGVTQVYFLSTPLTVLELLVRRFNCRCNADLFSPVGKTLSLRQSPRMQPMGRPCPQGHEHNETVTCSRTPVTSFSVTWGYSARNSATLLPRAKSLNKKSTSTSVPLNRQRKWPTSTSGHRLHSVAAQKWFAAMLPPLGEPLGQHQRTNHLALAGSGRHPSLAAPQLDFPSRPGLSSQGRARVGSLSRTLGPPSVGSQ